MGTNGDDQTLGGHWSWKVLKTKT